MAKLDVLLVLPPMYHSGRVQDYNPKEPMGLMYLASVLRQRKRSVEILDADILSLTIEQTVDAICARPSVLIGFSVLQRALPSLKIIVERLRQRQVNSHICCGGITATLSNRHILEKIPGIDSIVMGDGEYTFAELVEAILTKHPWQQLRGIAYRSGQKLVVNSPNEKPDLNTLPFPARDVLPIFLEKTNYATILASRGCYGICTFCSNCSYEQMSLGDNWRSRDPQDVVNEIEILRRDYEVKVFKFNDPNLFGPGRRGRQHVVDICKEIIQRDLSDLHLMGFCRSSDFDLEIAKLMRQTGFERLLIGLESSNPEILRLFRKGETIETIRKSIAILRETDIELEPGFLLFNPYTTLETLKQDIAFLEEYSFTSNLAKALKVYDGTPLQTILEAEGRLILKSPFDGYHEYLVRPEIAAIYMALKILYVEWLDTLKKTYQDEIWEIKRAPSFVERKTYYTLSAYRFELELTLLKNLISWTENGFSFREVLRVIERLKEKFLRVERYIIEMSNRSEKSLLLHKVSAKDVAGKIFSILTSKPFCTFPEQYRWKND